jgi:predicted RNA-binding protein with PIN domain
MRLLVDGMNVIGSKPDRWWRNRERAMRRLVASLGAFSAATGVGVVVVLDSAPFDLEEDFEGVTVRFAPGGRDAADDEIVSIVQADPAPETLVVATSDRELQRRVEALGAKVGHAKSFRERLDELGSQETE